MLNYNGPCKNLHGHSYELFVTVSGEPENSGNSAEEGMVIDFKKLKDIVNKTIINEFDHSLVLQDKCPSELLEKMRHTFPKINLVSFPPTSENLVLLFARRIQKLLGGKVLLHHLKLQETGSSFVEYYAEDNRDWNVDQPGNEEMLEHGFAQI